VDRKRSDAAKALRRRILESFGQCLLVGKVCIYIYLNPSINQIKSFSQPPKNFHAVPYKLYYYDLHRKYGVKVIIDLHAAPESQNGWEHSSSRDGSQEWGKTDKNIQQTVAVIDFLTSRYTKNPSLYAVELINEPLAPGASLESVTKYYKAGYEAVRKHSAKAYVVMSNRLGQSDARELFPLASGMSGSVIDVHYYNLFWSGFDNLTVEENIDYININRTSELNNVTTSNGPLTFVGT
jgi:aryl-phospho-beta-D-glucosidase BglC (GH1 family)